MATLVEISTIFGSAAFGAVAGKLLEGFVLAPIADRYERKRWLRQAKLDAYTTLTEEMLSLGFQTGVYNDPLKFKAICAKAILLVESKTAITDIEMLIRDIFLLKYASQSGSVTNFPNNLTMPDGEPITKEAVQTGIAIDQIGKRALQLAERLGADLKST